MSHIFKSLDAVTVSGPGEVLDLRGVSNQYGWQGSGANMNLEGSIDGANWFELPATTGFGVNKHYFRYIRANATSIVSPPASAMVGVGEVIYPGLTQTTVGLSSGNRYTPALDLHGLSCEFTIHVFDYTNTLNTYLQGSLDGVEWFNITLNGSGNDLVRSPTYQQFARYIRGYQASNSASIALAVGRIV